MTKTQHLISAETLCTHYQIEFSFVDALHNIGLIHIEIVEKKHFIHQDQIADLEKMIRMHLELNLNPEGIDVVFNLIEKEQELQNEIIFLRNRLRIYENE